jgi:hypothetical protein
MVHRLPADVQRRGRVRLQRVVAAVELTRKRLRRDSFHNVGELIEAINTWTDHWNQNPKPFIWHKTAQEIITKFQRGRATLHPTKTATHH